MTLKWLYIYIYMELFGILLSFASFTAQGKLAASSSLEASVIYAVKLRESQDSMKWKKAVNLRRRHSAKWIIRGNSYWPYALSLHL